MNERSFIFYKILVILSMVYTGPLVLESNCAEAGLDLPRAERDEVEKMRKELSRLTTDTTLRWQPAPEPGAAPAGAR